MDPFKMTIILLLLCTIAAQAYQFYRFSEKRSLMIDAIYVALILALIFSTDFLQIT